MKKIFSLLIITLGLFSNISYAQEVKLLSASSIQQYSFGNYFLGDVLVKNLAYEKKVTIVTRISDGEWQEYQANYVESLADGWERWSFKEGRPDMYADHQFAIKYEVDGQVFWDNNNNADYLLTRIAGGSGNFILNSELMVKNSVTGNWRQGRDMLYHIDGSLYVQNIGEEKEVDIIYSLDNWKTVNTIAAHLVTKNSDNSAEQWSYSITTNIENAHLEFAIRYHVNGHEYWDNNFRRNYSR